MFIERELHKILAAPEERNVIDLEYFITGNIALRWSASHGIDS